MREHVSQSKKATTASFSIPSLKHRIPGFGLESSQASPQAVPLVQPLHKPLTHDISRIPLRNPQAKLSISQPGDKYEQEADSVAQQVMQRMAQPVNRQSIQREALLESEEELQMKPLDISTLQRQEVPEDKEELQMKSLDNNSTLQREEAPEDEEELQMKSMVQRQAEASMPAALDIEASINQARGGGQAMAENIRHPMEQAFGADFSGVKVHTDGQSDQLNRSIQARAFTTGQDVFFRQGEYNPGGEELLAHELTHVVQQNGGAVQGKNIQAHPSYVQNNVIQRVKVKIEGYGEVDFEDKIEWKKFVDDFEMCEDEELNIDVEKVLREKDEKALKWLENNSEYWKGRSSNGSEEVWLTRGPTQEIIKELYKKVSSYKKDGHEGVWRFYNTQEEYESHRYQQAKKDGKDISYEELNIWSENGDNLAYHMFQSSNKTLSMGVSFTASLDKILDAAYHVGGDAALARTITGGTTGSGAQYLAYTLVPQEQLVKPDDVKVPEYKQGTDMNDESQKKEKKLLPRDIEKLSTAQDRARREQERLYIPKKGSYGKTIDPQVVFKNPFTDLKNKIVEVVSSV